MGSHITKHYLHCMLPYSKFGKGDLNVVVTETCGHQGKKHNIIYCCGNWNQNNILLSLSLKTKRDGLYQNYEKLW
jgi:hypothetical protein